jgi:predicted hotdog family 3-hydroxylacyl-ACP dehydratase
MSTPAPHELLPHAPSAVLLESIVARGPDGIDAIARVSTESPFASSGSALPEVALEIAAQAAAAFAALAETRSSARCMLVGADACRLSTVPVDVELRVSVRRTAQSAELAHFAFSLAYGTQELARGSISVWRDRADHSTLSNTA